jgi:hypothetical protein
MILLCSFFCSLFSLTFAQQRTPIFFGAGEIYSTTAALTGDSATWPIVLSLAIRDVDRNGFLIDPPAIQQLRSFSKVHADIRTGRRYLGHLLKAGARVFAPEKLNAAADLSRRYDSTIVAGSLSGAVTAAAAYLTALDEIAKEIEAKRTEEVDALVAQRNGDVTKRKGVLGTWTEALKGDRLKQSDGVKTGDASFAQLAFTDGVDVMIDPNSTVMIRESKMDRLDQSIRRDIALVRGGLLTTLTASAKERNTLRLQAGSSQSEVRSGKFWASATEERRVKLSNYDGTMKVSANKEEVQLAANEGTVVETGKPPMKPVQLLNPPKLHWERIDSTIYGPDVLLAWSAVPNSAEYRAEISPSKEFNRDIRSFSSAAASFRLRNIPLGILYLRLYAVDKLGLRGIESSIYTIVRIEDTQPPPIHVNGWETDRKYTILPTVVVSGTTEPDAIVSIDGKQQAVRPDGSFSFEINTGNVEKQIRLTAVDRSGNTRKRILSVVPMDTNVVTRIDWNGVVNGTTVTPSSNEISGRGTSYPSISITVTHGDQTSVVRTDSQGNWAFSLRRIPDRPITLVFESLTDSTIITTRILQVE